MVKFSLVITSFLLFLASCSIANQKHGDAMLSWSEVNEQAGILDGQYVTLCGWFVADRDICAVYDDEHSHTQEIWVRPKSEVCLPVEVFARPTRSWAKITGLFHHGGSYGLFGLYESAITDADVALSDCRR